MADTNFTTGTIIASSWLDDVNTNTYTILSAVAGTNALTGVGSSTVTVGYPRGVAFRFLPVNTNTGAVTINISGLGVKNVTKYGTTALVAGDLVVGSWAFITYDGTQFQLLNPLSAPTNVTGRLLGTQVFTANGTYTPTAGTARVIVECIGGGGGGGGTAANPAGQFSVGGGGGGGAYTRSLHTAGFSGAAITIGTAGTTGVGAAGGNGGTTTFGGLQSALGGGGGGLSGTGVLVAGSGGAGGVASGGNIINVNGDTGGTGVAGFYANAVFVAPPGGNSAYGKGISGGIFFAGAAIAGGNANGRGAGGGGSAGNPGAGALIGGNASAGLVMVYEYT